MISGKYMKELRESAGISQIELAGLANISQAHIAKIETEKVNPRLSTVNSILQVLQKRSKSVLCRDIMTKKIISVKPEENAKKAVRLIKSFDISQLPVMKRGVVVGSVSEGTVIKHLDKNLAYVNVSEIMDAPFPMVSEEDPVEILSDLFEFHSSVLVNMKGKVSGIITKFDLLGAKR